MRFLGLVVALGCVLAAPAGFADQVALKGEVLEGQVAGITQDGLVFTTEYGSGDITIAWSDLERIESDRVMVLAYGERGEFVTGRLLGVDGDVVLFGEDAPSAQRIPIAAIFRGFDEEAWNSSRLTRLRARYRFWSGALSLSGSINQGPTNSQSLTVEINAARRKGPTEYTWDAIYNVADSEDETDSNGGSKDQIAKRAFLGMRQQYNFPERPLFVFLTQSIEHDGVDDIDLRVIPRFGSGYKIIENERGLLSVDAGPSYVYEKNNGDFWALAMGGDGNLNLPYGSTLTTRLDFFPNVENWSDFLFVSRAVFTVPVLDWLSVRLTAENIHEGDPADDSRSNRFKGGAGVSLVF